jgi:hypothetical protein
MATKVRTTKSKQAKAGAKAPHNAPKPMAFRSIGELAQAVGAEPGRATIGGSEVQISRAERLCRLIIEKAVAGSVSDLKLLIRIMADRPQIAGTAKERWVLLLAGHDAEL